jgi:hypothetical protein
MGRSRPGPARRSVEPHWVEMSDSSRLRGERLGARRQLGETVPDLPGSAPVDQPDCYPPHPPHTTGRLRRVHSEGTDPPGAYPSFNPLFRARSGRFGAAGTSNALRMNAHRPPNGVEHPVVSCDGSSACRGGARTDARRKRAGPSAEHAQVWGGPEFRSLPGTSHTEPARGPSSAAGRSHLKVGRPRSCPAQPGAARRSPRDGSSVPGPDARPARSSRSPPARGCPGPPWSG